MTEIENHTLELLRALRNDIATLRTEMHAEFVDVKYRITNMEVGQAAIHTFIAHNGSETARQAAALDRMAARIERIERRIDLVDGPKAGA